MKTSFSATATTLRSNSWPAPGESVSLDDSAWGDPTGSSVSPVSPIDASIAKAYCRGPAVVTSAKRPTLLSPAGRVVPGAAESARSATALQTHLSDAPG